MEQTLTAQELRARLLAFLAEARDEKIGALYTLLKEDIEAAALEIPEEELVAMDAEWDAYKRGEVQSVSKEEFFRSLAPAAEAVAA